MKVPVGPDFCDTVCVYGQPYICSVRWRGAMRMLGAQNKRCYAKQNAADNIGSQECYLR